MVISRPIMVKSQRYLDHLAPKAPTLTPTENDRWETIDAQLCVVLKDTLDPSLKQLFRSCETCAQIWEHAKLLYTNDTQRLYGVCSKFANLISSKHQDSMTDYMGKIHVLFHEFNELLPPSPDPATEIEQHSKFFMLGALHGLANKYSHIRDQILDSLVFPTLTSTYYTLLRVPEQPNTDTPASVDDSSALVSHRNDRTHPRKQGKGRPKCEHCGKLGHKIDKCYALHECEHYGKPGHKIDRCYTLHRRPPRSAAVVQTNLSPPSSIGDPPFVLPDTLVMFNKFLKWYKDQECSSSTASIAHTGTSFVGLTQSSSLGPWVFNSEATDHITGNKSLFSSLSSPNHLPSVTLADGSRVSSHGVGTVKLFPSLTIDNVLYVPGSPFNLLSISRLTRSLDCVVSFTNNSVCLQDQSSKQVIGTGCESHCLYHLHPSTQVGAVMESPSLLNA